MYTNINVIAVAKLGPSTHATSTPRAEVSSSTKGYRGLILLLQKAHFLPSNRYEITGILCQAFNGTSQLGQWEAGHTIEANAGLEDC